MRFLVSAVVKAADLQAILDFIERAKAEMDEKLIQAAFTTLPEGNELPAEFYMPCPKDGFCVRMEMLGGQYQEVYQGTCVNGHELEFVDLDNCDDP